MYCVLHRIIHSRLLFLAMSGQCPSLNCNTFPGYRFLIDPPQNYTVAPGPIWQNTQGYSEFTRLNARTGSYQTFPWSPFHPRDVSRAFGYQPK